MNANNEIAECSEHDFKILIEVMNKVADLWESDAKKLELISKGGKKGREMKKEFDPSVTLAAVQFQLNRLYALRQGAAKGSEPLEEAINQTENHLQLASTSSHQTRH